MNHRPLALKIFAGLMLFVACWQLFQGAGLVAPDWINLPNIFMNLSTLAKIVLVGCLLNAWLALQASRILLLASPVLVSLVAWQNYMIYNSSLPEISAAAASQRGLSLQQTALCSLLFLIAHLLLFVDDSRRAIQMPNIRWWKSSKRFKLTLPVQVNMGDGNYEFVSFDISTTGLFATIAQKETGVFVTQRFSPNDPVEVVLQVGNLRPFRIRGEIVRLQQRDAGVYPEGVGIRFEKMKFSEQLRLQATLLFCSLHKNSAKASLS